MDSFFRWCDDYFPISLVICCVGIVFIVSMILNSLAVDTVKEFKVTIKKPDNSVKVPKQGEFTRVLSKVILVTTSTGKPAYCASFQVAEPPSCGEIGKNGDYMVIDKLGVKSVCILRSDLDDKPTQCYIVSE